MRFLAYNVMIFNVAITVKNYYEKNNLSNFVQEFHQRIDYLKDNI
jgi:hypothetical protein